MIVPFRGFGIFIQVHTAVACAYARAKDRRSRLTPSLVSRSQPKEGKSMAPIPARTRWGFTNILTGSGACCQEFGLPHALEGSFWDMVVVGPSTEGS